MNQHESGDPTQHQRPDGFSPLVYTPVMPEDCLRRSEQLYRHMDPRRAVRQFSYRPAAQGVNENLIRAASTALPPLPEADLVLDSLSEFDLSLLETPAREAPEKGK